jgi:hypothetical protein
MRNTSAASARKTDWAAFEDAKIEATSGAAPFGAGGPANTDPTVIPASNFTLSIMYVEPGQGNAAHTHEGRNASVRILSFVEDESGASPRGSVRGNAFPVRQA